MDSEPLEQQLEEYGRALPRGGRQLPAGRHGLPATFVSRVQRDRIIDAMAHAVAAKGYPATTVKDVIQTAGVSRRTFYEMFRDKQECGLAAYEILGHRLLAEVLAGYQSESTWPRRVRSGLESLLGFLAREPAYARAGIVEVLAAGPEILSRRDAAMRGFHFVFDPSRPEVPNHGRPPIVIEATVGGILEILYARIVREGPESLPSLTGELTYLALAPFIGHARATRAANTAL